MHSSQFNATSMLPQCTPAALAPIDNRKGLRKQHTKCHYGNNNATAEPGRFLHLQQLEPCDLGKELHDLRQQEWPTRQRCMRKVVPPGIGRNAAVLRGARVHGALCCSGGYIVQMIIPSGRNKAESVKPSFSLWQGTAGHHTFDGTIRRWSRHE